MEKLEQDQRAVDVKYGDAMIRMMLDEKPIFTVSRPTTGERWEIYADGRVTGFGDAPLLVVNGIALLKMRHEAQLKTLDKKETSHLP